MHFNQQQSQQQQNNQQQTPQQQHPHSQQSQQPNQPGNVGGPQQQNPLHPTGVSQGGMLGSGNMMGSSVGVGVGSPANLHHHQLSQQQQMMGNGDSYSMSQTQTINFTQQSLRQRNPTSVQGGMNGEYIIFSYYYFNLYISIIPLPTFEVAFFSSFVTYLFIF